MKIRPRNAPARRLERLVVGNPVTTRLESGVANCYPGLEYDHRNLDRRFFPGLEFNYVDLFSTDEPTGSSIGAHLLAVDTADPDLSPTPSAPDYEGRLAATLKSTLTANSKDLNSGAWFLATIRQGKTEVDLLDHTVNPAAFLGGGVVWRIVRMLEAGPVDITLSRRDTPKTLALSGWRRRYLDPDSGLVAAAYAPGELSQSLCSPWMHDFRDCSCTYWASNHPDIVLPPVPVGAPELPSGGTADPLLATTYVDWLRVDRAPSGEVQAPGTYAGVREAQIDHFEINARWQRLAFAFGGRESADSVFRPRRLQDKKPFDDPLQLAEYLVYAASIEHVLALEYLYARYTVLAPDQVTAGNDDLAAFVTFARHELLQTAVGEMRHLRWANELLWSLQKNGIIPDDFPLPALGVADSVPLDVPQTGPNAGRCVQIGRYLWSLSPEAIDLFVRSESPSGGVEGLYAAVVSTFRVRPALYPPGLLELAELIATDGVDHFSSFRQIAELARGFIAADGTARYLRALAPGKAGTAAVDQACGLYAKILENLRDAYKTGDAEDGRFIPPARDLMTNLDNLAEQLARNGIGVPYFTQPDVPPSEEPVPEPTTHNEMT